jgi:hypothetical protein
MSQQTLGVTLAILVLAIFMIAQSSVAIQESRRARDLTGSNYQFSVAMLVISLLAFVGTLVFLGIEASKGGIITAGAGAAAAAAGVRPTTA